MIKNRRAFIVGIKSTTLSKKEKKFLKKYKPWGVILFSRNVKEFKQIKKLISDIKLIFKDKKYPILIDQEGGRVNRLNKLIESSIFTAEYFGNLYKKNKYKFYNYYKIYINQISYLLKETNTKIILTSSEVFQNIEVPSHIKYIFVEEEIDLNKNFLKVVINQNKKGLAYTIYTSGSTGKPKGVLHTTGGYLVYASYTHDLVFDYKENDIYWCTADIGWITGHSYIIYGPLSNHATSIMFEGVPNYPDFGRFWDIIDKHKVNIFYTAPTALRALMKEGNSFVENHDLSSLKLLGTVGETIKEPEWKWYYEIIGKKMCPIIDTWWQTETGGILITPLPGITKLKPGNVIISLGDTHIYEEHIEVVKKQIKRKPFIFPKLEIIKDIKTIQDIENMRFQDFKLIDYMHHNSIKAKMFA